MSTDSMGKKRKCSFLAVTFVILFVLTTLFWGVSSGWGSVQIKRTYLFAENGDKISVIVYIPENASDENPAPVVMNFHGRANSAHTLDAWSLEEARRGYVVVNVDRSGAGESVFTNNEAAAVYEYAMTLSFVDTEQFMVTGFSSGTTPAKELADTYDNFKASIQIFPPFVRPEGGAASTNNLLVKAEGDQYNWENVGTLADFEAGVPAYMYLDGVEQIEEGKIYGSFEDGTADQYVLAKNSLHQTAGVSSPAIEAMLDFMQQCVETPNPLPGSNQIYWWAQILALACCVTMIFFAMALGTTLLKHPYFAEISQPMPANNGKRGKALALNVLEAVGIPVLTFIPVSTFGMDWLSESPLFPAKNFNGIWVWLIFNVIITLILSVIGHMRNVKKGKKYALSDYILASEGEHSLNGRRIFKSLILAGIVAALFYLWLRWIDNFFGVGYQFMTLAAFTEVSPERLVKSVPYILVLFIVLFVNGIKMNTSRRLADTDNIRRDMIKSVLMNAVIAGAAVAILLIVNYGSCLLRQGCGVFHFTEGHSSVGSLNFAFAFPFLMGSMGALNTYFFRKTGTVWLGAFLTAIIAGITAFVAQPLVM